MNNPLKGLTIYCEEPSTIHKACPGYSTTTLQETKGPAGKPCGCSCHRKDDEDSSDGAR